MGHRSTPHVAPNSVTVLKVTVSGVGTTFPLADLGVLVGGGGGGGERQPRRGRQLPMRLCFKQFARLCITLYCDRGLYDTTMPTMWSVSTTDCSHFDDLEVNNQLCDFIGWAVRHVLKLNWCTFDVYDIQDGLSQCGKTSPTICASKQKNWDP